MVSLIAATGWEGTHAQVQQAGTIAWGSTNTSLPAIAGKVINTGLGLLGLVFLGFALYAGFKWMTARGDSKAVDEAKQTIKNNIIGLIIIMSAYALTNFVMSQFGSITGAGGDDGGGAAGGAGGAAGQTQGDVPVPGGQNAV
ncbi:MAG: hypothetical protein A2848_01055 [Candidatus Magasanikbacteria bacterium RIFCSPHIGHO2_01_FULL_50_8]|uniref:Uncharacterized protein n=2 Tax=Candidatus Magasanikiibacteriota TaxID=1752731 RepID=A0A1F6LSG8_9BACT|nr:MAG: hypothetical protein A2848_01055 [Candidatus Magasanikbacteria bacterium RIFCSPHIGHO2_01_FULL_50_8]OGH67558.1 MAG: hypothetical protein A3C15_03285 [Candidatus Magasanikbacteria bacterium RIFCSPHIGHO2_02_FULL_50_9b]